MKQKLLLAYEAIKRLADRVHIDPIPEGWSVGVVVLRDFIGRNLIISLGKRAIVVDL